MGRQRAHPGRSSFSVERLEEHARSLAVAQGVMAGERKGAPLAKRLAENEAVLLSAYRDIAEAVDAGAVITLRPSG